MEKPCTAPGEEQRCYRASEHFVAREIAGELLLIPVGGQTRKLNGLVTFTESGAVLWRMLEQPRTKVELITAFAKEYERAPEDVRGDVEEFLQKAVERELAVECND